jgi:hypothetical protein
MLSQIVNFTGGAMHQHPEKKVYQNPLLEPQPRWHLGTGVSFSIGNSSFEPDFQTEIQDFLEEQR